MKIRIEDAEILRGDRLESAVVEIEGERIVHIGDKRPDFVPDRVLDGREKILMPGLHNTHDHVPMSLFRNLCDDVDLVTWLEKKIWPLEALLTGEDVYWGSMLSIAELIKSGVVAFGDMYFFVDDIVRAVEESGLKANLSQGLISATGGMEELSLVESQIERYHGSADGRIRISVGPHAPGTVDDALLSTCVALAKDKGVGIHIHLEEDPREVEEHLREYGMTPTERLEKLGVFDVHTMLAHCVCLDEKRMDILKDRDAYILHCPSSNLKLASGVAPIQAFLDKGLPVTIGTDGSSSNNNQNLWEEMHIASLIAKVRANDPTAACAEEILKMVTKAGAEALGFRDSGEIAVSKRADVILVRRDLIHHTPRFNPASELVYSTQASDVDSVIVDGEILLEHGALTKLDEEKLMYEVEKHAKALLARA